MNANALTVTIRPLFPPRTKALTPCSISSALPTSTERSSTPSGCATDWTAANSPLPAALPQPPRTAAAAGAEPHPQRLRHRLDGGELADTGGAAGIPENRRPGHARRDLLEQLQ